MPFFVRKITDPVATAQQKADIDRSIKFSRDLFRDGMNQHGYGQQTFNIETDLSGNVIVHESIVTQAQLDIYKVGNFPPIGTSRIGKIYVYFLNSNTSTLFRLGTKWWWNLCGCRWARFS